MTKVCNRCGAANRTLVCYRKDGSNMWALDLDLFTEQPKTWGAPSLVLLGTGGICQHCLTARVADETKAN